MRPSRCSPAVRIFAEIFVLLRVERPVELLLQEFGEADDRVERRAQFVAHIRQELALHLIGAFEIAILDLDLRLPRLQLAGERLQVRVLVEVLQGDAELLAELREEVQRRLIGRRRARASSRP